MGFWSNFLGHAAANAINEAQKETKKHNDMCYQLSDYMEDLNKYLERIGCKQVYIADYGCIDTGSISVEKRKMDTIKRKVEEYKNLGGNPAYIQDLDEMDEHISVIKYLKSVNRLERQKEFLGLDLEFVKDDIERELKEETSDLSLVNLQGNILSAVVVKGDELFIPYDSWKESANTIKIGTAKLYCEDTVQFLEYKTISLVFIETNIYVYSYELDDHSQLYCNISIGKNQKLNIASLPIPAVAGWSMVVIDDLQILCSNDEAEKIMELYRKHNTDIYLEEELLQQTATDNINQLSGVDFEKVCQQLVESMGFETETTKASGDGGIDLIAYNHQPLLSGKYIIQCKRYSGSVGEPIIRDLYGVVMSERANKGILMTTGTFTKSAIGFADGKPIELIDGVAMQNLLSEFGLSASKYYDYYCNNTNENRKFYDKAWTEYKNAYYLFDTCLIELKETSIWQENQERHDDVLFAFKVYEIFMMAVSIKEDIQFEMFCQMLDVENVSEIGNRQQYFTQLVTNEGGLREALKEAVLPYGNSPVGIFWNMIATISNEMYDYSFLSKLLEYHVEYVKKLAIALQYYVEKDDRINVLRKNTIEYYEETQKIMKAYIFSKQEGLL